MIRLLLLVILPLSATEYIQADICGQLGNQMFMVAAATSLALDHGAIPTFPDFEKKKTENIPINRSKVFFRLKTSKKPISATYREPHFHYAPIPYQKNLKIHGYFQSEKYFLNHKQAILDLFAPHPSILAYLHTRYSSIINHPKTVSVHYRDYSTELVTEKALLFTNRDYYLRAFSQFPSDTLFVVFSHRIDKCRRLFASLPYQFVYIENEPHYHDLYLMSLCKDHIICNSTFSWWGAYLNPNPNKRVIAPKRWFNPAHISDDQDLIPKEWIRL